LRCSAGRKVTAAGTLLHHHQNMQHGIFNLLAGAFL
jgi:hypothetical protein